MVHVDRFGGTAMDAVPRAVLQDGMSSPWYFAVCYFDNSRSFPLLFSPGRRLQALWSIIDMQP